MSSHSQCLATTKLVCGSQMVQWKCVVSSCIYYVAHPGVYCIAIERGKNGKAAGPNCLTNGCMKDCLNVLLVAITGLFNYCFDNACCPSVWNTSYLLTLYKGKGDTSEPNSARGIALQSRMLNAYCYILDRRMYRWAEWSEVFPDEQHGFRVNRSTETAIRVLQNIISDKLSEANTPLYVAFVDFAKAFDSIDRIFGKLQCCGISIKFVKALWPLINENYVQIISGRNVSDTVLQTKGIPQGQCLSPHLYSIFTADMPTAIRHETVDIRTQCSLCR